MKKALSIAILTLTTSGLILAGASSAYANKDEHSDRNGCTKHQKWSGAEHYHGGFGKMKRVLHHLDLSNDQQSEIEDIMTAKKPQMKAIHQQMKEGREAVHALSNSTSYDAEAVSNIANDQANLMVQAIVLHAETKADIFKVLTPEQRQQLAEKFESRKNH